MTVERAWAIGSVDRSTPFGQRHRKPERRTILLTIRLTEGESNLLAEAAEREGRTATEVIRKRVFGPLPPLEPEL